MVLAIRSTPTAPCGRDGKGLPVVPVVLFVPIESDVWVQHR